MTVNTSLAQCSCRVYDGPSDPQEGPVVGRHIHEVRDAGVGQSSASGSQKIDAGVRQYPCKLHRTSTIDAEVQSEHDSEVGQGSVDPATQ